MLSAALSFLYTVCQYPIDPKMISVAESEDIYRWVGRRGGHWMHGVLIMASLDALVSAAPLVLSHSKCYIGNNKTAHHI